MSDPRDRYVDEPLGTSIRGDIAASYAMLVEALNVLVDDPACLVRCEHGGMCSEPEGHDGPHDADGHCQWSDDDRAAEDADLRVKMRKEG